MRFKSILGPRGYPLGAAAAFLIALTTLAAGFFLDDYLHLATIDGHNALASPLELYVFGAGNEDILPYIKTGPYPWFVDTDFKARFFRPLACALMTLDRACFGDFVPAYHAHSILWRFLFGLAAMLVLRRILPPAVGVTALFLFVLDESHAFPTAWWSNRHAIIAVALGLLGLAAHLRARETGWRPGRFLSLAAFTGALLTSEMGLGVLAYALAYEVFGAQDSPRRRFQSILPAALLALGYVACYRLAGCGAAHSDVYIDPNTDPLGYLFVAPMRFLMLAGAQFFMLPCELTVVRPSLDAVFILLGASALLTVALALWILWPRLDAQERRALRWLIPGALLATTPSLAAIVTSRVLLSASLGGAAVIAIIMVHGLRAVRDSAARGGLRLAPRLTGALAIVFLILHLGVATVSWPVQVAVMRGVSEHLNSLIRNAELDETRIAETQVVVFNAPDPYTGVYPIMLRHFDGRPQPRAWWTISFAPYPHRIVRTGPREMEVEIVGGQMLESVIEQLFRSAKKPLLPGYIRDLDGLTITVLETGDRGPSRLRLSFEEPPESDRYQLLTYQDRALRRFTPPPEGVVIDLPYSLP